MSAGPSPRRPSAIRSSSVRAALGPDVVREGRRHHDDHERILGLRHLGAARPKLLTYYKATWKGKESATIQVAVSPRLTLTRSGGKFRARAQAAKSFAGNWVYVAATDQLRRVGEPEEGHASAHRVASASSSRHSRWVATAADLHDHQPGRLGLLLEHQPGTQPSAADNATGHAEPPADGVPPAALLRLRSLGFACARLRGGTPGSPTGPLLAAGFGWRPGSGPVAGGGVRVRALVGLPPGRARLRRWAGLVSVEWFCQEVGSCEPTSSIVLTSWLFGLCRSLFHSARLLLAS